MFRDARRRRLVARWWWALLLLCSVLLLPPDRASAHVPTLHFQRIGVEQGMSQNSGYAVAQDRYGFMWIGTSSGLNKYDGYTFTTYRHDQDDPTSLSDNTVAPIYEDRAGTLWVGTRDGLNRFDRDSQTFTRFMHDPDDPNSLSDPIVNDLWEDQAGNFWVLTRPGYIQRLDRATGTFSTANFSAATDSEATFDERIGGSIFEDREGMLWIIGRDAIFQMEPVGMTLIRSDFIPKESGAHPINMYQAKDGTYWIATDRGLYVHDVETGKTRHYQYDPADPQSLSGDNVYFVTEDRRGRVWVGSFGSGISIFDAPNNRFDRYQHDALNASSLSSDNVLTVFEDRAGLLWIGTERGGISVYNPSTAAFPHYTFGAGRTQSMSGRVMLALHEARDGTVWTGTEDGGLSAFRPDGVTIDIFKHDPADPDSLSANAVYSILHARDGTLWVGTIGGGLNRLDPGSRRFVRYRHQPDDPTSLSNDIVVKMLQDSNDNLWIGTEDGLQLLDPTTGRFTTYRHTDDPTSMSHSEVSALYEDQQGMIWVGTWGGGLNRFDPKTRTFQRYQHDPNDRTTIADDRMHAVIGDAQGRIWIGTPSGADRLDPATGIFTHWTTKNGLPAERVLCIQEDTERTVWMSTPNGLVAADVVGNTLRVYTARDGLGSDEFVGGACFENAKGRLYFGGLNGWNTFQPQDLDAQYTPPAPPIVLTAVRTFNQPMRLGMDTAAVERLALSYRDTVFSFDWAALDFTAPASNQYAYKLDGFDQEWIEAGTTHSATYTNLDGGEYVFRVRAANSAGVWNEQGISVPLTITTPPWRTWWAYSTYTLVVAGMVVSYVRWRTATNARKLTEQAALAVRLEEQVEARTAELSAANSALRTSEEQFRAFFEQAPVGIAVATNGTVVTANPAYQHMFGYSNGDAVAGRLLLEHVTPDDRSSAVERLMHLHNGAPTPSQSSFTALRRDGSTFPVLSQIVPTMPYNGSTTTVDFVTDMTALRQAQEERDQFFTLSSDLLCIVGTDGFFKRLNPAWEATLGWKTGELLVEPLLHFVHPDDRAATFIARAPDEERHVGEFETRCRTRQGDYKWLAWSATLVPERDVFYAVARDVTEQKLRERARHEQIEQTAVVEERSRLARELHDSVTQALYSLGLIAEGSRFQAAEREDSAAAQDFERLGEIAQQALKEMRLLIYQLRSPVLQEVGLAGGLQQLLDIVERHAKLRTRLLVDGERDLPYAIEEHLYRIAQEALNNVVKHARATTVTVHLATAVTENATTVTVDVRDNGTGFDLAQVVPGIGLSSMQERAAQIGGVVDVVSTPDDGTMVRIKVRYRQGNGGNNDGDE